MKYFLSIGLTHRMSDSNLEKNHENIKSLGTNIVDSMDTLYIMGMDDEFQKGKEWISSSLNFSSKVKLSLNITRLT